MPFRPFIDRASAVALGVQLKGQVEYAIACGDLNPGARLPTVRQLAETLGVSPVTVSQVYRELQKDGLLEALPGRGTYVTEVIGVPTADDRGQHLEMLLDHLAIEGQRMGLEPEQLVERLAGRLEGAGRREREIAILVVGLFADATSGYADALQALLGGAARVRASTFDALPAGRRAIRSAFDLLVTLPYRVSELRNRVGSVVPVTYLRFLPSEHTRVSLARIDPRQRVLGVARLPGFLPALEAGIARYAPHTSHVTYSLVTDPHLPNLVSASDVVVYASGAEAVREHLGSHERAFEFRHAPDPAFVETHILPIVRALRAGAPLPAVPAPPPENGESRATQDPTEGSP